MSDSKPTSVRYPDGHVLLRNLARDMPVIDRGEGIYLFDKAGKRYVDASGGALVVSVGHGNREVSERIAGQLARVGYVNGTHFTSEVTEELAARLATLAAAELPAAKLTRAAFLSSGSEVVEAAVKLVRQLWMERGQPERTLHVHTALTPEGRVLLMVDDSGAGLSPELQERLFAPFFTTKPHGHGLGLGLPISRDIIRSFGGELRAENRPEGGARFTVDLPERHPHDTP